MYEEIETLKMQNAAVLDSRSCDSTITFNSCLYYVKTELSSAVRKWDDSSCPK